MLYRIEDHITGEGVFSSNSYYDIRLCYDADTHERDILDILSDDHASTHGATYDHRDSDEGTRMYKHFFTDTFYHSHKEAIDLLLKKDLALILVEIEDPYGLDVIYEDYDQVCLLMD